MKTIQAFWLGVREFRSDFTANLEEDGLQGAYDWGREFAHIVTLRRFDKK